MIKGISLGTKRKKLVKIQVLKSLLEGDVSLPSPPHPPMTLYLTTGHCLGFLCFCFVGFGLFGFFYNIV